MGQLQKVYLKRKEAETTTSTSGTVTLDLPTKDYLSQLEIVAYQTNTTLTSALKPVALSMKKFEVLDGAEVIKSLSGVQAQALAYYWGRTMPYPHRVDWESTETYDYFHVRFGRFPGDLLYMLDMAKLTNPQLKITYDFATTSYHGITYTPPSTPTFKWTVLADILRGTPPTPIKGFIRSQQIFDYNPAATGTKYVDIPRTEPIVGIMCKAGYLAYDLLSTFDRTRLNINNGELIPFDIYAAEMEALQEEWFAPSPEVCGRIETKGAVRFDSGLGLIDAIGYMPRGGPDFAEPYCASLVGGFMMINARDYAGAAITTQCPMLYKINGLFPHHTFYLPSEKLTKDGVFTLPAPDYAKILLELTSASASTSDTVEIILETLGM